MGVWALGGASLYSISSGLDHPGPPLTLSDKEVTVLPLQGLPGDVEDLTAEVEGHGAVRPTHHAGIALSDLIAVLVLSIAPPDRVLYLHTCEYM